MAAPAIIRGLELRATDEPVPPLELIHERRLQPVYLDLQDIGVTASRDRHPGAVRAVATTAEAAAPVAKRLASVAAGAPQ